MIKKETQAIFEDGDFKGEFDWKGGIPLSEGEVINIHLKDHNRKISYVLVKKTVDFFFEINNQVVKVAYKFKQKQ